MEEREAREQAQATTKEAPSSPPTVTHTPNQSDTANGGSIQAVADSSAGPVGEDEQAKTTKEGVDPPRGENGTDPSGNGAEPSGNGTVGGVRKTGGDFASFAKRLSAKNKGGSQPLSAVLQDGKGKQNGCAEDLDLPLGSEAHCLDSPQANGIDSTSRILSLPDAVNSKAAAQGGMMGWQSFNSDVSTSAASTASLDMLLNDRLVDPEEVLFNLGFGGPQPVAYVPSLARIPQRFLQSAATRAAAAENGSSEAAHGLGLSSPEDGGGGSVVTANSGYSAAAVQAVQQQGHARKRTGFQTLARTVSLMRGMGGSFARHQRHSPVFGHHHGSRSPTAANSPAGTPPHGGSGARDAEGGDGQINSILLPVNQRYLASKGYYRQQGWPRGSYIEPEEDREAAGEETRGDAMSKRKMFQKTRSQRQNWSLCDSGEKENDLASHGGGGGAGGDKTRTSSSGRDEWFTKSMDDSLSQDEGMRARIDSVGLNTFFSTTTEESSTDSLDAGGSDTERALEEIRRQYYESQNSERKESEELFLPKRKGDKKTSFGDLLNSSGIGVFQEEDSEENAEEDKVKKARRFGTGDAVLDRLKISSDGDDEGTGGSYLIPDENNRSNNYFISPASSRQTTVEKSPTLHSSNDDDFPHNEDNCNTNEGDNNNNSPDEKDKLVATNNRANLKERGGRTDSKEVKIIVSSFSSGTSWQSNSKSSSASPEIGKMTEANVGNNNNSSNSSNNNKLTVERAQQASSDSGSSSSGATTVGVPVSTDADADGATPRNVLSEESDGITDRDSISRTHSPCGFPPSRPGSGSRTRSDSHKFALTTSCCQTSETDFIMAAQAELGEAVNATVRRSSPLAALGISARAQNKSGGADTSTTQQKEGGDRLSVKEADREGDTGSGDGQSKVRLSALPTSINPLELMRRLRRSQDDLLRTGSVQSDSSGFGDADPTPESGHSEGDPPKVSSLGSSHDSGDTTLAGSAGSQQHQKLQQQQHQQKQMATQTPVHSAMFNADETQEEDGSTKERGSPLPGKDHSSFITTCFIPSLNPREPYAPEGLRHRRGGQHPPPPYPYLPQQQQQHYSPLPQQPHFIDLQNARRSSSGFKPEMSFYGQNQTTSRNPSNSGSYYSGYEYSPMQHPADFPPHHPRHSSYQPYRYDVYDDSGSSYYTRGFPHSRSYRSAMSDSEWSGYTDRDYFNQSYFYDYKYNHPPPSPPQHRRFFAHRPRSLDHPSDYMDYASDPNRDGFLSSDKEDLPPPRRYRSQLELYTTGTGRVGSQPNADPRKQQQQKSFSRGQSEDSVLDSTGVTEGEEIIAGSGRNQMPLSEELAKAMGGKTVSNHTPVPLPSSAESSPSKAQPSVSSSSFISSVTVTPGRDSHSNKRNVVSNIFIPNASSVTLTPATSDISKHESVVSVSAAPTDLSHIISAAPGSPAQESSHINGQNLPALAGNLRSLPQVLHSTDFNGHNHRTTITIATSSLSSSPMPITQSSNPVASAAVTSSSLIETPAKVKSSFSSASASAFRSRQPKSCDILDDDDENSFLDGEALSGVERGKNPQTSSASYISQIYHETKRGVGTGHRQKEGIFTSQLPYQYPGSPSLRHRHPGPPPSPSRPYGYSPYHGHHPPHPRPHSSSSSSLPPMPLPARHPLSFSQCSDEMEGYYSSSMAESSSDFSFRSTPEWGGRAGILNARKLARLINQPVYFKGSRRPGCSYRPRRLFKEWTMLSKRKRLQEENRLLQHTLHRYKTELQLMETVVKVDYQAALPDMTEEEREQLASLEWLWSEIKGQVAEMEQLLLSRIKSVQSGNDFHTLLANMGIINKMTELIKEQIYHQKLISSRGAAADDEDEEDNDSFIEGQDQDFEFEEDTPDELQMFDEYDFDGGVRHGDHVWVSRSRSFHGRPSPRPGSQSWIAGVGTASTPRYRLQGKTGSSDNFGSTSSTSNLPNDLNASLEQIKTSLLSQVQQEIKDSTRKLELDLQAKDKEIQELKNQIGTRSAMSTPDLTYRSVARIGTGARPRSATPQGHNPLRKRSHSRSRMMGDRIVQETDV